MADINSLIAGTPPQPINPLQILSGYQDYANKVLQGRQMQQNIENMQLQNQTGQQALAQTMAQRHAQIMFGLSNLPDDQLAPAASKAIDDELATGQIDQQRYDVLKQMIDKNQANPAALRTSINSGLISNLAGPEALKALTPQIFQQDVGGQILTRVGPSPMQALGGQTNVGLSGAVNRTLPPGYQETGGQVVPVGGAAGQPTLTRTLTPGEAVAPEQRLVQGADGTWSVVTASRGALNAPGLMPKGMLGPGGYPGGAVTSVPATTERQLGSDQEAYTKAIGQVPQLTTGTQSLNKALQALNAVATGQGTEGLASMRAYAVSLGNVLGIDTGGVNVQDMNRAELEKYLTDYARQSATAGRSDEALNTAFKANASGHINNAAAQDVVRTNIGRDRQSIATAQAAPNQAGQGYQAHASKYATDTDPRGFAWDTYTPAQRAAIVKETQGKEGEKSAAYQRLARGVGEAQRLGLLNMNRPQTPNVNAAP